MFIFFEARNRALLLTFILSKNECNQLIDENIPHFKMMEEQEMVEEEKMTEEEEIEENDFDLDEEVNKQKSCKTFEALPENWKTNESWEVGFIEAPECPEKELIIIVNTAHKNRGNRLLLRRYFEG